MRRALSRSEFSLAFQPLIGVADESIRGFEALLRWNSPEYGLVSPVDFIPVAEETGLIVPIGEWVLREACAFATRWPDSIEVSVNLSPVQFKRRGLVEQVRSALADAGLRPGRLVFVFLVLVLLLVFLVVLSTLHKLRDLGT